MSNDQQIINLMGRLRDLGCRISADGDKLRLRKTKNEIPAELIQQIKINKTDILAFLNTAKDQAVTSQKDIPKLPKNALTQLSFAQQRLWFLGQMENSNATYNMPICLQLEGKLDVNALYESLAYVINRHESLRMYFPTVEGQPQIRIKKIENFNVLSIQDLSNLDQQIQSVTVQTLIDNHVQEPFNLKTGPLFKAKLLQLKDNQCILLLNMHHISSDGWSIGIFIRELRHAYLAFSQGQKPSLDPLPIQYSDFATWQRNWLQGEVLETQMNYWKKQLKDAPPRLELPTDHPRPPIQSYKGSHYSQTLTPELTKQLNTLSQQEGVSLYMLLLAVFNLLLSRYSRQNDLCIGSPIANRPHPQTEELIGFFANTLVLRNQIKPEQSFQEFLQQARQTCLEAYQYQDIPFEFLVEQLKPVRSLSYNPIFQVIFAVENNDSETLNLPGLKIEWLDSSYPFAKFDLSLLALESDGQLNCNWEYATDLFETITIQRMTEHWEVLLQQIVTNPQQTISTLSWLTKADQKQLELWNQTNTNYPQDKTLVNLFEEQVKSYPDNVALVFEQQSLTYQELNQKANQLAHYLRENYQIELNSLIGICIEPSLEMIIGLLGILKVGSAYVPIDSNYPESRINYIVSDSKISILLTQSVVKDKFLSSQGKNLEHLICLDKCDLELRSKDNLTVKNQPNSLAYIIYTSGSTGKPKGVAVNHQAISRLVLATNYIQITPEDRIAQAANIAFDAATFEIWGALLNGVKLIIIPKSILLSPSEFAASIQSQKVSVLFLTTALFNQLAALVPETFSSLRYLLFGGEAVDPKWVQEVLDKGSPQNLLHVYGPTENTTFSSWYLVEKSPETAITIPIGKPISNTRIYILDQYLQPVPIGVPGELCISGIGLARGYLNRPDLTAEKFIEVNLFGKIERIYKTGDLAKWGDDGNIKFLGRIDHQIKLRGFRIELGEIESVLLEHPAVKEAIVNLHKTENNPQLVAYVTGKLIDDLSQQLKRHLKTCLPDYMIPSQIMRLDELPLTPNGKIDRQALPHPDHQSQGLFEAPCNKIEQQLTEIWSLILECEKISIHDNFFDLGGHSILAIKLLNQIQKNCNQELSLTSLFQNPTIAQLAQQLSQVEVESSISDLLVLQPSGQKTPIFCVAGSNGHAFYFRDLAMNFADEHPVYGLETPGRDGSHPLPISVEDHASSLIKTLRQKQPKGPYILTGYSSGCSVALEMAFQLEQQGETISLLGIFDAGLVANPDYITQRSDLDWIWNMIERIEAVKGISLGLDYQQLAAKSNDQNRWELAAEALYRHNVLPEHSTLSLLKTNLEVMKRVTLNYAAYQPNFVISAPIVLFRAQDAKEIVVQEHQAMSHYQQSDWGWQPYSNKPVQVVSVPGNHGQMLYEPNVKILADQLKKSIQEHFSQPETYDVVICGGGLAGLTLARQLKLQKPDISIVVLDKMTSPLPEAKFKVGESTVEVGAFYLANTLQLTNYFEEQHLVKLGLRYFFFNRVTKFQERPELGLSEFHLPNSYQIDRGKLENDLRQFNVEAGIELRENCSVNEIELSAQFQEYHKIVYTQEEGDNRKTHVIQGKWVIDAMGRRRFLQRKLRLDKPNNDHFNAVWFRVEGRLDVDDFVPNSEEKWHNRVPNKNRYYSTNHLCGQGYWVWLIPLGTGYTSIGIVAHQEIHPLSTYYNYELAYQWLQKNEPILAFHLAGKQPLDFMKMPKYSYSSKQVFSDNCWACVGEAGVFPDPFYSPGTDSIGFSNSLINQMIILDLDGKLTKEKVDDANHFYLGYTEGLTYNIQNVYNCLGNGIVMGTKFIWDVLSGWTFSGLLMFNSIFLDQRFRTEVQQINSQFFPLSYRMQRLFKDWANQSLHQINFEFIDYLAIPFVNELRSRTLKENQTESEIIDNYLKSLQLLEEVAQIMFYLALEDTMPEMLPKINSNSWLNAWAISLDASKWQADGLFTPKTKPRNLDLIKQQLWQAIGK